MKDTGHSLEMLVERRLRTRCGGAAHPLLAGFVGLVVALGIVSNTRAATVPVSESFESYANGYDITNAVDWSGVAEAGIVTNDASAIAALTTYTNAGHAFPLPGATHEKVLQISNILTNSISSATGGVVITEMLFMPAQRDEPPTGSTNYQFACYVNTNDQLVVWHRGASSNAWITLTNSPTMETGTWYRVAVRKAYASHRYQVTVNDGSPIEDAHGWSTVSGGTQPGPWFDMVQTNGYMSRFRTEGNATGYLDDMVFTNRSVHYTSTTFAEVAANDGRIATTNTMTLAGDTFVDTTYIAGTHFSTSGVPAGLDVTLAYVSPTQIEVTLSGQANPHDAEACTNAMGLTLADGMFALGNAADVAGYAQSALSVNFGDPPVLTYVGQPFVEGGANDGTIGNTVTITLTGDSFAEVSPLVAGTHYSTSGIPPNLDLVLTTNSATELVATLSGQAVDHESENSTSFTLTFLNAAFQNVATNNISGTATNLGITFASAPVLTYSSSVYSEAPANDGTVLGGTITLSADLFDGTVGEDFVDSEKVEVTGLPGDLTAAMTLNADSNQLAVAFSGAATNHLHEHDVTDLSFVFQNSAFAYSETASMVESYNRSDLGIDFADQPVVAYSGTSFSEASANKGTITNSVTLTLTGDTFVDDGDFGEGDEYSVANEPDGLSISVTRNSDTQLTVSLTGTATAHTNGNDISNLIVALQNEAFTTVAATNITGSSQSFSVDFDDQPVISYSATEFSELSDGQIDNTTPIEITISGDTFTGADNSDFVADDKVTTNNVPPGLTLVLRKSSDTKLLATLTGTATAHGSGDSIDNMEITFLESAITAADANQVSGYMRSNLSVTFNDSTLTVNTVPYRESFETYADGYPLGAGEGWQPAGSGVVTNDAAIISALIGSFSTFPLTTNHTRVLRMAQETTDEIKSGSGGTIFSDMMFYVTPREEMPEGSTDYQFAMFVDTNQVLNVWHCDTSDTPTNTWATLSGVTVTTGAWHRVTVEKDYAAGKYRLYLDGNVTFVENPTTGTGWFNMVGTANAYMSRVRVMGATADMPTYLDDLVVDTDTPLFLLAESSGSVFRFR